ncbi:IclR family transcriptional regulator [Actinophytocola sp.]|uniref:IclR family transcriptional regulator n=1 Tax=Actinophytocola sp. TaxID=1872138 RepID=UPI002D8037D5|nr:IclR family transcriptional regulator [Actinophytocola sp.]HET9138372.1 IclR family transcriptional regulator [Actinophytocola sp.]
MSTRRAGETRSGLTRAVALLDAFDDAHRVLTLTALARRAGLPIATAHRLLADLTSARLLVRRPDGGYEIGARVWHLGLLSPHTALREAALPYLQDLVATTGHTAHLAVLDGAGALVLERLAGTRSLPTRHTPGLRLPLHCTAVGKALLAHAPAETRTCVLAGLDPHTRYTITDPCVLRRQLDQIRGSGVARSTQEHRLGVFSLAMAITGGSGPLAAVGLLAPLSSPRLSETLPPLRHATAAITASIGRA